MWHLVIFFLFLLSVYPLDILFIAPNAIMDALNLNFCLVDDLIISFNQANMEAIMRNRELTETRMMQVRFYDAFPCMYLDS